MNEERYEILQGAFVPSLRALKERSDDRLASDIDERVSDQTLEASMSSKPPGATQWTTHGEDTTIVLTRDRSGATSCNVDLRSSDQGLIPVTNERAADLLDIALETWLDSRDIVEMGMSNVSMSLAARNPEGEPNHGRVVVQGTEPNSLLSSSFPTRPAPSTHHASSAAQPYAPPHMSGPDKGISR